MNQFRAYWYVSIRQGFDFVVSRILIALMIMLVVDVCWQVISRYVFNSPSAYTDELARYLLIWIGLLGAAYALGQRLHLAIDLFLGGRPPRTQRLIRRSIHALIFLFSAGVLIYGGSSLVVLTYSLGQTSSALGINLGTIYLALPLSGVLTCIYASLNFAQPLVKTFEPYQINT